MNEQILNMSKFNLEIKYKINTKSHETYALMSPIFHRLCMISCNSNVILCTKISEGLKDVRI